ncbi:helix-turn-helix transcriptional regulator [Metapseudomonas resinovorans]|uniref:helix-turn-helix transcriptional regulator n=1 Tax=Metapseudomonas resinovorans TaxID=53412 RepID=UPI0003A52013|nr:helix-turn-helix transcriptional regulator [Pseudomonas resinovorans]
MTAQAFDLARWLSQEAPLIEAIGRADFPARLLASLFAAVPIDTAFIVAHVPGRPPAMLEAGRVLPERREEIQRYLVGPYLLDPVRQACIEGRRGLLRLADIAPDRFQESEYYRSFYVSHGLADEVDILIDLAGTGGLALSMGRLAAHGAFDEVELATLRAIEPLVGAAARRHWGTSPVDGEGTGQALHRQLERAFERFGDGCLTEREAEVARLILRGHSSKSVAHELAISTDTVGVHRKNIHAKLGISSQGELFSLFLASATASGAA